MTDDGLTVKRAAAGDAAAFGQLVRLHQSRIRGFLLRLCGGRHALADDLAQETFLHAWRKIAQFRSDGSFAGWLLRIAWSRFLMENRRPRWEPITAMDEAATDPRGAHAERMDLTRMMARLAPAERAALTLCHAMGYSHAEAAAILRLPLGTLKSHALRGREKLQMLMVEQPHDP